MIELAIALPLPRFVLQVAADLGDGVTAVMGPSGAGKTSLLEAIAGLRDAVRGRLAVAGEVFLDSARGVRVPVERRRVGYVPQDAGLFPHLTVRDNVRFGVRVPAARVEAAIDVLELRPLLARRPATLSGGERQRVALARALAMSPRLLLLDEPLAALDVALRERILPYLLRVRDEWRVPVLYVTHNVGEALAVAGDALLLDAGGLVAHGPPHTLLGAPSIVADAAEGLENLLPGQVARHDDAGGITEVDVAGGLRLAVPLARALRVGMPVVLALRAEDVLVAAAPVQALSARNVCQARVVACERAGVDVLLRCAVDAGGPPWLVRVTPAAVAALGLAAGSAVWLAAKSHSIRVLGATTRRGE